MTKTDDAIAKLHAAASQFVTEDSWLEYLKFSRSFHNYSARNQILIWCQKPEATHVAGYRKWQSLGRQVRKGEKGLWILAPRTRKDEDGTSNVVGFGAATVFDISQTDGDDVPEMPIDQLTGLAPEGMTSSLIQQIIDRGFRFSFGDVGIVGANGVTKWGEREVIVDSNLSPAQKAKTTAHELAHVLLHDPNDYSSGDRERGTKEVEAESVAYLVCQHFGLDASAYTLGYVAGWSGAKPEVILQRAQRIQSAVNTITGALAPEQQESAA